jgi:hypothetical protein
VFTIDLPPAPISKHWMAMTEMEEFNKQLQEVLGEFNRVDLGGRCPYCLLKRSTGHLMENFLCLCDNFGKQKFLQKKSHFFAITQPNDMY